jgi:hypothetical protein
MEALKCFKRRFHLNGLKHLVKNNYIGEDVLEHVNKFISDMEAAAINMRQTGLKGNSCPSRQISSYFLQSSNDSTNTSSMSCQSDSSHLEHSDDESINLSSNES